MKSDNDTLNLLNIENNEMQVTMAFLVESKNGIYFRSRKKGFVSVELSIGNRHQ